MNTNLLDHMSTALHAAPDAEDEATAWTCLSGVEKWLRSDEARSLSLAAVDAAYRQAGHHLSFAETVDAVLDALAIAAEIDE